MSNASFKEDFLEFIMNRRSNAELKVMYTPEYKELAEDFNKAYGELRDMLNENGEDLLRKIESSLGCLEALVADDAYKQGIKDGIQLVAFLGLENCLRVEASVTKEKQSTGREAQCSA